MLTTDSTYIVAKKIKAHLAKPSPEYSLLGEFLSHEYSASLLNGDIYYQPIVKSLGPTLRLIIDSEIGETKLPIYHLDRRIIGEKFIAFCKELNPEIVSNISVNELNINYIVFDEMRFEEIQLSITNRMIIDTLNDSSIAKLIRYGSQYIFLFEDSKNMEAKNASDYKSMIHKTLNSLLKEKGYAGKYISKIQISFDIIESLRRAGSEYNYLR